MSEQDPDSTSKTYDSTAGGMRLSQTTTDSSGTSTPGYYSYNAHSDVEAITGTTGTTTATYGYTAYGDLVSSMFTGKDKSDATASPTSTTPPYSSYRFNAMRWDSTTGQYDMGFRNYDPGLNQFTTRDMYNGALADAGLATDPFTGSRYAFGDGNPVSNIENDGHTACANTADAICPGQTTAATAAAGSQEDTYSLHNIGSYIESMILFNNPQAAQTPSTVNRLTCAISGILQPGDPLAPIIRSAELERRTALPRTAAVPRSVSAAAPARAPWRGAPRRKSSKASSAPSGSFQAQSPWATSSMPSASAPAPVPCLRQATPDPWIWGLFVPQHKTALMSCSRYCRRDRREALRWAWEPRDRQSRL